MNTSSREEKIDRLERALTRAHEIQEASTFSPEWADGVMRDVRRQATFSEVPYLLWRAAAVIALISTLFVGSVLTWTARQGDADFSALLTMSTADSMLLSGEP